jgi:hypothetical protein
MARLRTELDKLKNRVVGAAVEYRTAERALDTGMDDPATGWTELQRLQDAIPALREKLDAAIADMVQFLTNEINSITKG